MTLNYPQKLNFFSKIVPTRKYAGIHLRLKPSTNKPISAHAIFLKITKLNVEYFVKNM